MAQRQGKSLRLKQALGESDLVVSGRPPVNDHVQTTSPWYLALLLMVLVAPFLGILIAPDGKILGNARCDNPSAYYFYSYYLGQCLREGTLPLWNPYIQLGLPFIADGEASVFHPLSLLFVFLQTGTAINWLITIAFVLTGLFFYGYLRALKLGQPAAWCGAITWSFSSAMISRIYAGHLNILLTFISIPLIMMLWEKYRAGGGVRCLLGVSTGYALMILAYYPQLLFLFSLFLLFYVLIQSGLAIADHSSSARAESKAILSLGAFILLGIGLGSIQLFPSLDFVSRSFRQKATIEYCGAYSFPPENFMTLIAPRFFGTFLVTKPALYWGRTYFWEMWLYLGILPLIMAVAGAWLAPRRRRVALLVCAAVFLILGLGKNTPLFPLIYAHVPFFDIFRGSSKNTLVTLFCLVTLSAHGFESLFAEADEIRRRSLRRITAVAGTLIVLVSLALLAFLVRTGDGAGSAWISFLKWVMRSGEVLTDPAFLKDSAFFSITATGATWALVRGMMLVALSCGVIFLLRAGRWRRHLFTATALLVLADLLGVFLPLLKTFDESITQYGNGLELTEDYPYPPRILNPNPRPNVAIRHGYSSAFGYVGNPLRRYNEFISRVQGLDPHESQAMSAFRKHTSHYKMLALDAIAIDPKDVPPGTKTIGQLGKRALVPYEAIQEKLPRAFLAEAPQNFSRSEDALEYVFKPDVDVQSSPAIERPEPPLPPHPLDDDEFVRIVSFQPNKVELVVQSKWPRALVMCGMYEKNWTAKVNGETRRVRPANYVYRSVRVPAGVSRVVFQYHPMPFYWGVAVSAVSLAILLLIAIRIYTRPVLQVVSCGPATEPGGESRERRNVAARDRYGDIEIAIGHSRLKWIG